MSLTIGSWLSDLSFSLILRLVLLEYFVLISEDIVMYVVLLRVLVSKNKRLHEASHRSSIVRQLTCHLHYDTITDSRLTVNLSNLSVTVGKVQLSNLITDILQYINF